MARVMNVALEVTLDNGDVVRLNIDRPAPEGDNPRFLTTSLHTAMRMLEPRMHDALEAVHGPQQYRLPRPSDELLAPRIPTENPFYPEAERVVSDEALARAVAGAPKVGQLVRFPDVYDDNVFRTLDPEAGIYEVYQPRGIAKGERLQVNTDVARWTVVTHEDLR
jgi:hypothetical protein